MSNPSSSTGAAFGMIGLGVMGSSLALNVAEHGFSTVVWNREGARTDEFVRREAAGLPIEPAATLSELVHKLERPRRVFLMIKAGPPVDQVLAQLSPMLEAGDIVMDGGNSHYEDSRRREAECRARGLRFMGVGVSGGEEGARRGPSIMPGGAPEAYARMQPLFEAIAARSEAGPCVTHVGPDGAGHFVKTVHNGIEYADMQLLAEAYDVMRRGLGLGVDVIAAAFSEWNRGPLASYLVEITATLLKVRDPETGSPLVELVLDEAEQKGTGRWTAEVALSLGVPIPTIAASIDARLLSSMKRDRVEAARVLPAGISAPTGLEGGARWVRALEEALLGARLCAYAQGMDLMAKASLAFQWGIHLREIARIWKAGCIIRARVLDTIMEAFAGPLFPRNLLVAPAVIPILERVLGSWRAVVGAGAALGIPLPALGSALGYFDSYRSARLPQNLTQAQRDAFGAHTYRRLDTPDAGPFHTQWL